MIGRRHVLGGGISVFLAGLFGNPPDRLGQSYGHGPSPNPIPYANEIFPSPPISQTEAIAARAILRSTGIPEWKQREIRRNTEDVFACPNIEALKSISPAAKYRMIIEQRYRISLDHWLNRPVENVISNAARKTWPFTHIFG
jgi:hypothetical protein